VHQSANAAAQSGTASTGSGGGGGGASSLDNSYGAAGSGGSGIVIIAYTSTLRDLTVGSGLTYSGPTTSGGNKIYQFTAGTGVVYW
jgi:hypothetical protein